LASHFKMSDTFGSMSLAQLKLELARRGARTTGRKSELVTRLRDYERNQDFTGGRTDVPVPDELAMPKWPSTAVFKTLTMDHHEVLPPTKSEHLHQYVIHRQAVDQQAVSDIQAIKKGKLMAEESVAALSMFQEQVNCYKFASIFVCKSGFI